MVATLPDGVKLTWLGHATFLLECNGKRIVIDPWVMGNPACPEDFKKDPGPLDALLITHGHFDHIGDAVELGKKTGAQVVSIPETSNWLASKGLENLVDLNKGGTVEVAGCRVHMTHAVHSCGITDGDQIIYGGEAAGYVIEAGGVTLYHAGDTAVFSDMALIGKLLAPDIALLPIGDHYTMGPRSAAEAVRLLGVKTVVPMHWGTFPLLAGTPDDLRKEADDVSGLEVVDLKPGGSIGS